MRNNKRESCLIASTVPITIHRQSWHQCCCQGRLQHVLREFLGACLVQRPVKLSWMKLIVWPVLYIMYCILLLPINIPLLHIITWPVILIITVFVITLLSHHYYALLHPSLLRIITVFVITLLLHYYYIIHYLRIITVFVIILLLHNYYLLLHFLTYYYDIIITYYYIIIKSLLSHYQVILTSLFPIAETGKNHLIIACYAFSMFFIIALLLPIITIIAHYNILQTGQLADAPQVQRVPWWFYNQLPRWQQSQCLGG